MAWRVLPLSTGGYRLFLLLEGAGEVLHLDAPGFDVANWLGLNLCHAWNLTARQFCAAAGNV